VSIGLIILAVLPHKIPLFGRQLFGLTVVRILFAAASIYIGLMKPVLGMAMLILLASVIIMPVSESFALMRLNKDKSEHRNHWLGEVSLAEEPEFIQTSTRETNVNFDKVSDNKSLWEDEKTLGQHPRGIQEKPVPEYDHELE